MPTRPRSSGLRVSRSSGSVLGTRRGSSATGTRSPVPIGLTFLLFLLGDGRRGERLGIPSPQPGCHCVPVTVQPKFQQSFLRLPCCSRPRSSSTAAVACFLIDFAGLMHFTQCSSIVGRVCIMVVLDQYDSYSSASLVRKLAESSTLQGFVRQCCVVRWRSARRCAKTGARFSCRARRHFGICISSTGSAGDFCIARCIPFDFGRPKLLGIMIGMDQMDSFA